MPLPRLDRSTLLAVLVAVAAFVLVSPAAAQSQPEEDPMEALSGLADLLRATAAQQQSNDAGQPTDEDAAAIDDPMAPAAPQPQRQAPNAADLERLAGAVRVDEFELVDLHVVNEDLGLVLQLLSIEARRNIVASRNVVATITADLYGVTFHEALSAILEVNGLGYVERGEFIYVYTAEELAEIRASERARDARVIRLEYLNAEDGKRFAEPLLSEGGAITVPDASADFNIPDEAPTGKDSYASGAMLVIHDYMDHIDRIESLLRQLDTKPTQVLVEATILQAEITEDNAWGIDFSVLADLDFSDLASPLNAVNQLISGDGGVPADGEGRAITSSVGNTAGAGGLKIGVIDNDVAFFLRALDEVTDVTVVSKPKLLTLNRQAARVLVGTRVGYLNTTTTETATTQSVEFLDTGTQLHVRPFVSSDGLIRLELKPQISAASLRDATTSQGQRVTIPDEDTTEIVTNLYVRDGQTVVLGGLFTESTTSSRNQVPGLGNLPLIGGAFRGHEDRTTRAEIIFLITPTVMNDAVLTAQGAEGEQMLERTRVGTRRGLLPWSRQRQVGQLLIDADRLVQADQHAEALLKIQRALALEPRSPDALVMREQLVGTRELWPSRSLLEAIANSSRSTSVTGVEDRQ